jgi:DNA-directed RNA polymerase subunit RPC12/RpoP
MSRAGRSLEIACRACGQRALARAEAVYDGFRKTGECFVCTACGHRYASREATPFLEAAQGPALFTDADRETAPRLFRESERRRCCAYCAHRVVNPFGQRCGLDNREIESTDLCGRFERRTVTADADGPAPPDQPADPLSRLFGD